MPTEDAIKNLAKLSPRERQVLEMICSGLMEKEIAQKLKIRLPTVKSDFRNICVKIGIDQLGQGERRKIIYQIYCPLLESSSFSSEQLSHENNEPNQPEPGTPISVSSEHVKSKPVPQEHVSSEPEVDQPDSSENSETEPDEIIKMVKEDKLVVKTPTPDGGSKIPPWKKPEDKPDRSPWITIGIIVGVLAVLCLIGALVLGSQFIPRLIPASGNAPSALATEGGQPDSPQTLPSSAPVQQPPVVATNPPQPTSAPLPTAVIPSISLPFSDTFENGSNPAWRVLSGDWLIADHRYTISNADSTWAFSTLNDPTWTDYRVLVNIKLESSWEGEVAIIVRNSESKFLTFHIINILSQGGWAYYDGNSFTYISGHGSIATSDQFDLELEVSGGEFIARINGMETQRINLSGYSHGGVGLGVNCFYPPCASFSGFQVSPFP